MKMNYCCLNGRTIPENQAFVNILDSGFLYGDGVYETIRICNGKAFMFLGHIKRLKKSLHNAGIRFDTAVLPGAISSVLKKNNLKDAVLRISVTRGNTAGRLPWVDSALISRPTLLITTRSVPDTDVILKEGVKIVFLDENLFGSTRRSLTVKSMSYQPAVLAKIYARQKGAFESVFVTRDGYVAEGASSNIFFVKERKLFTPATALGILPGITRSVVMKIARQKRIKIVEGYFKKKELI